MTQHIETTCPTWCADDEYWDDGSILHRGVTTPIWPEVDGESATAWTTLVTDRSGAPDGESGLMFDMSGDPLSPSDCRDFAQFLLRVADRLDRN